MDVLKYPSAFLIVCVCVCVCFLFMSFFNFMKKRTDHLIRLILIFFFFHAFRFGNSFICVKMSVKLVTQQD